MTVKEKILDNYIKVKAHDMRVNILKNIENDLKNKIELNYPKEEVLKLLNLKEKLHNISFDEFLGMEFNEDLQNYYY